MEILNHAKGMKQLTLLLLMVIGSAVYAQDSIPTPASPVAASNPTTTSPSKKGLGFGVSLSTNGIGTQFSYSLLSSGKLILRAEGSVLNYELKNYSTKFGKTSVILNGPIKLGSAGIYADWHPFGGAFKLVAGVAYMMTNVSASAYLKDSVKQNDITISPQDVGKISIELKPASFAPYIGLGFGRAVPKHRVSVSFEMGAFYIGSPTVNFTTNGMLAPTENQGKVLSENMAEYKWLPKLSLGINFRLSK